MILNGVITLILRSFFTEFDSPANYVTVVEDRLIMSAKYCLPVQVFHFWPKLTRDLSAIAELLVNIFYAFAAVKTVPYAFCIQAVLAAVVPRQSYTESFFITEHHGLGSFFVSIQLSFYSRVVL